MSISSLPPINASLNALSGIFLAGGFFFIRRKNIPAHRKCMLSAFATSTVFLTCYLIYHFSAGTTRFAGRGWVRPVYFGLLISHILLAIAILPLAIITLNRALRERFDSHRRIARWTWPIWMYVSVTGVLVYLMLYHLYPSR